MRMNLWTAAGAALLCCAAPSPLLAAPKPVSSRYAQWKNGPPSDPGYFPIAVWLQSPENARRYEAAGFNVYVGLWQGPTDAQLAALKAAGMPVICEQNAVGLAHRDDPTIIGWMHGDEPDNAQEIVDPVTGKHSYGGPVPPPHIVSEYDQIRAADPTRPVMLNLGQGVANDQWNGRGSGAHPADYLTYVKGADIISFDVYPVAGLDRTNPQDYLWLVPKGVDRLTQWTDGKKLIWNCIECTHIGDPKRQATPDQVKSEVWMSLIHGSNGLIYFVHQFQPKFDEHALLDDPVMLPAVTAINHQIHALAPVLNSPTIANGADVQPASADAPVDAMVKRHNGAIYVFSVGMRNRPATASFTVHGVPAHARAEVIGENRSLAVNNGQFQDQFTPYAVHLYRITAGK